MTSVYLSLTSIKQNESVLIKTLQSLETQDYKFDKCYVYLSQEPYLLDQGFSDKKISAQLEEILSSDKFSLIWTENTGPYRKLLPLLEEKFSEDCLIITLDDDTEYHPKLISSLVKDYQRYKCCISYRGFTLDTSKGLEQLSYDKRTKKIHHHLYNFHTGKGGVLYHPSFFRPVKDVIFSQKSYQECAKTADDVWFNFCRISANIPCFLSNKPYMVKSNESKFSLHQNYNFKNNTNDVCISKTVERLMILGYLSKIKNGFDSSVYWEKRYQNGGNSGKGSYGQLAQFKADVINNFVKEKKISSLIDYGVGDGNQLNLLDLKDCKYTGLDVSETVLEQCQEKFPQHQFYNIFAYQQEEKADLILSCDVLYHLIDESVYREYLKNLFSFSEQYVIIYARDEDNDHAKHVKFRKFTGFISRNYPDWNLVRYIPNKFPQKVLGQQNDRTSPSDFYIYQKTDSNLLDFTAKSDCETIKQVWTAYIESKLIPLVGKKPEGNIYSRHHSNEKSDLLVHKQSNIIRFASEFKGTKVLEIGFNAGFSTLLMKLSNPNLKITCVDINEHHYVVPCYLQLNEDFDNIKLLARSSRVALPELIESKQKYDLIHIDGDHRIAGARQDFEECLKLSHSGTVIIFDDTNLGYLNDLCDGYITKGKVKEHSFEVLTGSHYNHRFLEVL